MPRPRSKTQARHNASKACDLCRVRKCQCIFDSDTSTQCRRCNRHDVECTFVMGHKPRGPRLHRPPEPSIPPLAKVEMRQLCSIETLHRLITAFDNFVYPLFPLIHPPTFHEMLDAGVYNTDPVFLRRCMSLCAITVASAPNMEAEHCIGVYNTYRGFVNRACDLVAMSRIATQPGWEDNPSYETAIDSVLLSLASHYAGCTRRGSRLLNEAAMAMRDLQLHRHEGLAAIPSVDVESCKRAFWVVCITQIQDSFVSPTPHMVPGFPARDTEWDIMALSGSTGDESHDAEAIKGFTRLVHLFTRVRDILSAEPYRPALASVGSHFSSLGLAAAVPHHQSPSFAQRLATTREILARLEHAMGQDLSSLDPPHGNRGLAVAAATVQLTFLYLSNIFVDIIFAEPSNGHVEAASMFHAENPVTHGSPGGPGDKAELWAIRESIAKRLLEALDSTPSHILELNGFSLIHQIRKIAASLLDCEDDGELASITGGRSQFYVAQFTLILADLDLNWATSSMLLAQ